MSKKKKTGLTKWRNLPKNKNRRKPGKHQVLDHSPPEEAAIRRASAELINPEVKAAQHEIDHHNQRRTEQATLLRYGLGATRSPGTPRFGLVPPEGARLTAERFTMGATVHGDHNWKLDMPIEVIIDHLESHINDLKAGNLKEESVAGHLGAIGWAQAVLAWYADHKPTALNDYWQSVHNPPEVKP